MIKGRMPNDNITLLNVMNFKKKDENGKRQEFLTLVYKDCNTDEKYFEEITDPDYIYYIAKEDNRVDYNRLFIPEDDVDQHVTKYSNLEKDIAINTGRKEFYYNNLNSGNYRANKTLHLHPDIFGSDMHIEDHYRLRFDRLYKNDPNCKISKSFFDIETDPSGFDRDVILEHGECPINAITIILQDQQLVYTFLLRNKRNPQIQQFEDEVKSGSIFTELANFVVSAVGGPVVANKYNIHFKYNFAFFNEDNEINLINALFLIINKYKPDFALAWNMAFDMTFIINRIINLGYNPEDILCHPDFKNKYVNYYVDEFNKSEFAERGDKATISSYTVYEDQLINFASRRKSGSKFPSYRLDAIGEAIAKVRKLDYKHITNSIIDLPYKDYKTFVFYNIMDTIVQYCIEYCTDDTGFLFSKAVLNNTRYDKVHRQSVYLTNRGAKEFYNSDRVIMGNNPNKFNSPPATKFAGAFVANPKLVNNDSKMKLYATFAVNIFNQCVDFDFASLYPSINMQYNLAPNTIIGKTKIYNKVHDLENRCKDPDYDRGGAFIADFVSDDNSEFACRWFNLARYDELRKEVEYLYTNLWNSVYGLRDYNRDGTINVLHFIDYDKKYISPIIFNSEYENNVQDVYMKPNLAEWEEYRNDKIRCPNQQFRFISN